MICNITKTKEEEENQAVKEAKKTEEEEMKLLACKPENLLERTVEHMIEKYNKNEMMWKMKFSIPHQHKMTTEKIMSKMKHNRS